MQNGAASQRTCFEADSSNPLHKITFNIRRVDALFNSLKCLVVVRLVQRESHDRRVCWLRRSFSGEIKLMANLQEKNPMKPRLCAGSCATLHFL